jgi:hypothetical protein
VPAGAQPGRTRLVTAPPWFLTVMDRLRGPGPASRRAWGLSESLRGARSALGLFPRRISFFCTGSGR